MDKYVSKMRTNHVDYSVQITQKAVTQIAF